MPATTKTKKAAPVKKAEAKTATPKPEAESTVVVEVPDHTNPQVLEQLYVKEGMSAGEIAKQFGVSRAAILNNLKRNNIEITTRKSLSPNADTKFKNKAWMKKALESGRSIYSIAKECGVAFVTVRLSVKRLGLESAYQPTPVGNKAAPKKKTTAKKTTAKKAHAKATK